MKTSAFTTSLDWKARSMMPTQLLRFSCVTFVPSGIRSSAACHGSAAFSASERKLSERQRTQRGTAATELREAFGVRGACSRFTTAPASWTHSKRFAEFGCGLAALCCLCFSACSPDGGTAKLSKLETFPPDIKLTSAKSRQEIVVQATFADGTTRDVSARAKVSVANPKVASIAKGTVSPLADGQTELRVTFAGRSLTVPVSISQATNQPPISFKHDVMPVFKIGRASCRERE